MDPRTVTDWLDLAGGLLIAGGVGAALWPLVGPGAITVVGGLVLGLSWMVASVARGRQEPGAVPARARRAGVWRFGRRRDTGAGARL